MIGKEEIGKIVSAKENLELARKYCRLCSEGDNGIVYSIKATEKVNEAIIDLEKYLIGRYPVNAIVSEVLRNIINEDSLYKAGIMWCGQNMLMSELICGDDSDDREAEERLRDYMNEYLAENLSNAIYEIKEGIKGNEKEIEKIIDRLREYRNKCGNQELCKKNKENLEYALNKLEETLLENNKLVGELRELTYDILDEIKGMISPKTIKEIYNFIYSLALKLSR